MDPLSLEAPGGGWLSLADLAAADQSSGGGAIWTLGTPAAEQLARINSGVALVPQNAEDLFAWGAEATNNNTNSRWMYFDDASLLNMAKGAKTGNGISYLRNHDKSQDVTGRVFHGAVIDGGARALSTGGPKGAVPAARDVLRPDDVAHRRLVEMVFMRRGPGTADFSPDQYIGNIEAGVQASLSVTFDVYSPYSPGSRIVSDIDGLDLFAGGFDKNVFWPGVQYEIEDPTSKGGDTKKTVLVVATARIEKATQSELSGVFLGAVPGTVTQRAAGLFAMGAFSLADARRLEETYQVPRGAIVGDLQTINVPAVVKPAGVPAAPSGNRKELKMDGLWEALMTRFASQPERLAALGLQVADGLSAPADPVGALLKVLEDEKAELAAARDALQAKADAERAALVKGLGLAEGETPAAGIERLVRESADGRAHRASLVAELGRQMTRNGLPPSEDFAALVGGWSAEQLITQTKQHKAAADKNLTPGMVHDAADALAHRTNGNAPVRPRSAGHVRI